MTTQEKIHIYQKAISLINLLNDCEDEDLVDDIITSVVSNDSLLLINDYENLVGIPYEYDENEDIDNGNEECYG